MQSFREQSNYHSSQQTYPPDTHGPQRLEEYSPRQENQMFQGSYAGRRGTAATPASVASGDNSNLQNYQAYRKESGEFYYIGSKEGGPSGNQNAQRRPSGPVQNYVPTSQGNGNNSSASAGFGTHYGREGHHSQFSGPHSATTNMSQFSQDFPGSFSPGGGQYPPSISSQQLRQQLYQSHHPIPPSGNSSATPGTSHLQHMQRYATLGSSAGYPLRMGQYGQHYQSSAGSSSSFPPPRFGQSNYEGYSPGGTNSQFESPISGSSYGTQQQGYGNYSQHLKNFEASKMTHGVSQGQNAAHVMQFSNTSKLLPQSQAGQYTQSEVPVRSPMQFQQNFSPISNPSPAASVVQSPSCSSTPSPLMTGGESFQCSQGSLPIPSRNRMIPVMPQLSPNTQISSYKSIGVEGQQDKTLTDPGLSSLSALSSQVANLPNTVQHMLLSDALAPNKKAGKRPSRKADSCANSETSSQAEEQIKSPMTESLDGSCSSSSGDPGERVRQLSGQSTSSEAGYKGPPSEKPASPCQGWQNEPSETALQEPVTVPEPSKPLKEVSKASEKSVGVIVSMETMTCRSEKLTEGVQALVNDDIEQTDVELPEIAEEVEKDCTDNLNGESSSNDPLPAAIVDVPLMESDTSLVDTDLGIKEATQNARNTINLHQTPKCIDAGNFGAQGDRKIGRNEKFPSLLQEVLQGHHQQERRYARPTQEHPAVTANPDVVMRSNVLISQTSDVSHRSILGKNTSHLETQHWGQWDRKPGAEVKPLNLDLTTTRKYDAEPPSSCHEQSSAVSERKSVICDISPLRQIVRESSTHVANTGQERPADGRAGQSVILPSGMLAMEKTSYQAGGGKLDDLESTKTHRKRTGEHCMPYSSKDSVRGSTSPRSMAYDSTQDNSSNNSRASNSKKGTGRARGRSPGIPQEVGEKLKMSPGRSRGPADMHHINPTISLSERASREAFYSAFFQNSDGSALGYHTNSRSSYGEPHPAFTSPLHYKRQMYQQEEYKEWLGSSAQAILSASQHRQEVQKKSPRQEPFHVRSPGRNENEGLGHSQPSSYHEPSNLDYSRQLRINEGTSSNNKTNVEIKRNSQKTPPGDSNWLLGHQASPEKKAGSGTNQLFNATREFEISSGKTGESSELPKPGCNVRPSGTEEVLHHNPLIMRRRVRSFISPIPSKRQLPDDKGRPSISPAKANSEKTLPTNILSLSEMDAEFSAMTEQSSQSTSEQKSPPAVSLSSPTKTKILPPRKGRGLKLEAIVQKITSPNVRRTIAMCSLESGVEPVTLDDILSLKGKGPDVGNVSMQEITEGAVLENSSSTEINIKNVSPKSTDAWAEHNEKLIKKEMDEQSFENKELPHAVSSQPASNHLLETRVASPAFELKCSLPPVQATEIPDKERVAGVTCTVLPKPDVVMPPKGYFPSGKKKGRPVGSVNKQKKQQLQQNRQQAQQLQQNRQQAQQLQQNRQQAQPLQQNRQQAQPLQQNRQQDQPLQQNRQQAQPLQQNQQQVPQQLIEQHAEPQIAVEEKSPVPILLSSQNQQISDQESEPKPKRRRRERRKAPGTTKRKGRQAALIIAPLEPEIKLKYASQMIDKTEPKAKSFFPYIHVENKEEFGLSCVIINAEEEEQRWKKITLVRKGQRSTSPQPTEGKALPVSSFMVQGPAITESTSVGHLVCCFCGKWANYRNLGDLFGPFYSPEYASTLSKYPPPKKSVETPKKERHKDVSYGSKTDSDEEEEKPQQAREQRSLSAHPRFKRRNRSGDCASSWHAVHSRRKTTDSSELNVLDSSGPSTADVFSDQVFQIPELPLDSNEFWMHEGCVLWTNGVYFVCGKLYGLQEALDIAREMNCAHCHEPGATLGCYNKGCVCCYHFPCATDAECLLSEENFSVRCPKHKTKSIKSLLAEQTEQS